MSTKAKGRPKLGDGNTERFHMAITAEEISAIDDWRYANRIPTRSEAVRQLVRLGIDASKQDGRS
ncbi:MAG TPA: hypothetical protein VGO04_12600 [Ensifer sp.]|jgi:metal-responsive CopG/Arc/MetJ family transcriptional regulator|uniref:hypothetical protein n=1 Tax=Ensifer sp. TaxID=1872086 RepID=UPI002E1071CA|nr:hypothetical protein [Ensifer sp.]